MSDAISHTKKWIAQFVIGHNICPFAQRSYEQEQIAYTIVDAQDIQTCWSSMNESYAGLQQDTGFIIFTQAFQDFDLFLDFYYACEAWLEDSEYHENFQIVGFHPQYMFHGESEEDHSHYTNRSPYPMIHILRRDHVSAVIKAYGDIEQIPQRNIQHLRAIPKKLLTDLLKA